MIRTVAWAAMLGLVALAASGQVYKWVDEKGRTHYSETPPPDNKSAKKVDTGPAISPAAPAREDWKQKELDSRRRTLEKQQAEDASRRKEAQEEQVMKGRCRSAQRDLQILEMQAPIFHVNEKGEKVYLEDRERPAAIARARKEVQTYCK
jgi:hypothetical protein